MSNSKLAAALIFCLVFLFFGFWFLFGLFVPGIVPEPNPYTIATSTPYTTTLPQIIPQTGCGDEECKG